MEAVTALDMEDTLFSESAFLEADNTKLSTTSLTIHSHQTTQMLLTTKPPMHVPEAGLNPLVDAASYIFTIMGNLHFTKHCKNLEKLQSELIQEIENFRETIQTYNFDAEYVDEFILISRYSLCTALDNIIANTTWGNQGKWRLYSLVDHYKQNSLSNENVLIILERLVCAPDVYIDVMEFIYICLNLGLTFKNPHSTSEFTHEQLEQITYSLYKRIRIQRGNYNKILTPFPLKQIMSQDSVAPKVSAKWLNLLLISSMLAALITGIKLGVDRQAVVSTPHPQQQAVVNAPLPQLTPPLATKNHGRNHELHANNKKTDDFDIQ